MMADDQSPEDNLAGSGDAEASLLRAGIKIVAARMCKIRKQIAIAASSLFSPNPKSCPGACRSDILSLNDIVAFSDFRLRFKLTPMMVDQVRVLPNDLLCLRTA